MSEEPKTMPSPGRSRDAFDASAPEPCLSDDDLLSFVQGRLHAERLETMHEHVDSCEVCQRLVVEAAHALDAEPISESASPSWNTVFQPNVTIGNRYRVLRLVARGGMGEVYEAFDNLLHERVALKTVTSTACDNAQAVRYLKAEVQLARRISHPNVCRIYDFGTHVVEPTMSEVHFLVMEFVDGECLGKKLRQEGALPVELAISLARQLLHGLRAAHQAGILHRDFKSDNVMLRQEGGGRVTPVILDFGLARALNESGSIASTRGQGQAMVGTIGYMAPEQIEGEPLSTASDVYAFGVVWFEMLTGKLPFEGTTPVASAMARLHREPLTPSHLNPAVPAWLDEIVLGCLNRQRRGRFAGAEEVLHAVDSAERGHATESGRRRTGRRSWRLLMVGAGLGLASIAGTLSRPDPQPRTVTRAAVPIELPRVGAAAGDGERSTPLQIQAAVTPNAPLTAQDLPTNLTKRRSRPAPAATAQLGGPPTTTPGEPTPPAKVAADVEQKSPPPSQKAPDWLPIWSKSSRAEPPVVVQ